MFDASGADGEGPARRAAGLAEAAGLLPRLVGPGDALGAPGAVVLAGGPADAPAVAAALDLARAGGPLLAVGDGLRVACAAGLIDGRVVDISPPPEPRDLWVRVEGRPSPWTAAIPAGRILRLAGARAALRFVPEAAWRLEREARIALRLAGAEGEVEPDGIAGVLAAGGPALGLVALGGEGGQLLFASLVASARGRPARVDG